MTYKELLLLYSVDAHYLNGVAQQPAGDGATVENPATSSRVRRPPMRACEMSLSEKRPCRAGAQTLRTTSASLELKGTVWFMRERIMLLVLLNQLLNP